MLSLLQRNDSILWAIVSDEFKSLKTKRSINLARSPRLCFHLLLRFYLLGRDCCGVTRTHFRKEVNTHPAAAAWLIDAGLIERREVKTLFVISKRGQMFVRACLHEMLNHSKTAAKPKKPRIKSVHTDSKRKLNIMFTQTNF